MVNQQTMICDVIFSGNGGYNSPRTFRVQNWVCYLDLYTGMFRLFQALIRTIRTFMGELCVHLFTGCGKIVNYSAEVW